VRQVSHYSISETGNLTYWMALTEKYIYGRQIEIAIKESKPVLKQIINTTQITQYTKH